MLSNLRKILQPLSKVPNLSIPVDKICQLVVAPSGRKVTKQGHQHARKTLNDICEKDNLSSIGKYLERRLETAMISLIELLQARKDSLENEDSRDEKHSSQE